MGKWNETGNMSFTFDMQPNEEMKEFFQRMQKEFKDRETAFKERIKQLFDERIKVEGKKADEAYNTVLQVFADGYQCGWNDLYSIIKDQNKNQDNG